MNIWQKIVLAGLLLIVGRTYAEDTVHYYYTDPQGTVLAKTDAAGNVIASYDYAPYGSQVLGMPSTSGPTGYTGHVNDPDTGLVYMQARYYDPAVGRFLSVDPVGPAVGNPYNFNRFAYANNNPIVNLDADGRDTVGENIDESAQAAANAGNNLATYGWAFAGVAWSVFGAESVSQVTDKGSSATTGEKLGAGLEVLSALPPVRILGKAAVVVEDAAKGIDAAKGAAMSSRAARRQAMREAGIPTSQQPVSQLSTKAGRQLRYELPAAGGGTRTMVVTDQTTDRVAGHGPHWEAGAAKVPNRTDPLGRLRVVNDKTKVDYGH